MDAADSQLDTPLAASHIEFRAVSVPGYRAALPGRLYRPVGPKAVLPGVVYLHGGGFVGGSLEDADLPARFIALHTPAAVLTVAYSLAPVHPFPAAPEDAYAAVRWLHTNARQLGVDSRRLAISGDDAGGSLAAAVALIARDRNGPALAAQVLISPMLDPTMTLVGDPNRLNSDIQPQTCAACYSQYLPRSRERMHPYAAPLTSLRLKGLPPALIATASCDVLHLEAEHYATALIRAGVPVQVTRFDATHTGLATKRALLADVAEFLRWRLRHLGSAR